MLTLQVDFSGLEHLIGTFEGIGDAVQDSTYMGKIIAATHAVATKEFDVDAAATAGPINMSHMYEFGVRGITRGDSRFGDPTNAAARLWVHHMGGNGNTRNMFFTFRPALVPNPRPSATFYGVSNEVISKLSRRKYIFRNKAAIVEMGQTVEIKPKIKKFNFVPFYGKPARNPEYADSGGYIFRPYNGVGMESTPGAPDSDSEYAGQAGTFTNFWTTWWATKGDNIVSDTANEYITKDIEWLLAQDLKGKQPVENILRYNSRGRVYNRRRRVKAKMLRQAKDRGKIDRH